MKTDGLGIVLNFVIFGVVLLERLVANTHRNLDAGILRMNRHRLVVLI